VNILDKAAKGIQKGMDTVKKMDDMVKGKRRPSTPT